MRYRVAALGGVLETRPSYSPYNRPGFAVSIPRNDQAIDWTLCLRYRSLATAITETLFS
jgi:hypothetical protein